MGVIAPFQVEEAIAIQTAAVLTVEAHSDRLRKTADSLTGKTIQVRFDSGDVVGPISYTAVNRTQTGSNIGVCDVTLDAGFHTETGDFTVSIFKKTDAVGDYVLQWPRFTITFVDQATNVFPTATPTATPTPTPTPT